MSNKKFKKLTLKEQSLEYVEACIEGVKIEIDSGKNSPDMLQELSDLTDIRDELFQEVLSGEN